MSDSTYTLERDGDDLEKDAYHKFVKKDFPKYEEYWQKWVAPLTNRPDNINFKNFAELKKLNIEENEAKRLFYLSQLHYTVLRHLLRAYDIIKELETIKNDGSYKQNFKIENLFEEGFVHIYSAQDVAFTFLERLSEQSDKSENEKSSSFEDFESERKGNRDALNKYLNEKINNHKNKEIEKIRFYRNWLMHNTMLPKIKKATAVLFPEIETYHKYHLWYSLDSIDENVMNSDFDTPEKILNEAWEETVEFLNKNWQIPEVDYNVNELNNSTNQNCIYYNPLPINCTASGISTVFNKP